jgi:hypothetical protein
MVLPGAGRLGEKVKPHKIEAVSVNHNASRYFVFHTYRALPSTGMRPKPSEEMKRWPNIVGKLSKLLQKTLEKPQKM